MKWINRFLCIFIFIISMLLITWGQRNIGPMGLLIMIIGLVGILVLLYLYNRKYQ